MGSPNCTPRVYATRGYLSKLQEEPLTLDQLETTGKPLLGALLWWDMEAVDTPHADLGRVAEEVGFPAIFLPIPVSREVAFSRAIIQGCVHLPKDAGKWRADLVETTGDATSAALIQEWAPADAADPTPWKGRALLTLPKAEDAPTFGLLAATKEDDPVFTLVERVRDQYDRQRNYATADEVRAAAHAAMAQVKAIRVRPGLWFATTSRGIERSRAVAAWLRCCGRTRAGAIDLVDTAQNNTEAADYVTSGLTDEVAAAVGEAQKAVDSLKRGASLRDRLQALTALEDKIATHAAFLGEAATTLRVQITTAGRLLDRAAATQGVEIESSIRAATGMALSRALEAIRAAAANKDVAQLKAATDELRKRQGAANAGSFGELWARLRKLAEATTADSSGFGNLRRAATEVRSAANLGFEGDGFGDVRAPAASTS